MDLHELFEFPNPFYEVSEDNGKAVTNNLLKILEMDNEIVNTPIIELFPVYGYTFALLKEKILMHTFESTINSSYMFIVDFNTNKYYLTSSIIGNKIKNINSSSKRIKSTFILEDSNLLKSLYQTLSLIN